MRKAVFRSLLMIALVMVCFSGLAYGSTSVSKYTGSTYTHSSSFSDTILVDGVDVSYVQKNNVDWEKAKADGVDFAIIRVGARGYGSAGKLIVDDYYKENIEAAQKAGVMVGVYFFSQAVNELEAVAEAKYTLKLIDGYDLDLPIFMDYEFAGGSSGRLTSAQLSKIRMTANVESFCQTIEEAGYEVGVYANLNFLNNTINGKSLGEKYPIWVAQYNTSCSYGNEYQYWQYTSSGSIDGYSGRVDTNFWYLTQNPMASTGMSLADATVTLTGGSEFGYVNGRCYQPAVSVTWNGLTLTEGIDYEKFYLKNGQAGTGYVLVRGLGSYTDYKLVPFTIDQSTNVSAITIDRISNMYYTGAERKPSSLTMYDTDGRQLVKGKDYTFTVTNCTQVGTATVTINFIGNYTGTRTTTYQIIKGNQTVTASKTSYSVAADDKAFTLTGITASGGGKLSYASSNTAVAKVDASGKVTPVGEGTATITVTAAETSNYKSATTTITVTVGAANSEADDNGGKSKTQLGVEGTTITLTSSLTDAGKVRLDWKKSAGYKVDYYEVFRSTSLNDGYGSSPLYTTSSGEKLYYVNTKNLTQGKTYYYMVRGVRILDGEPVYTQWSSQVWETIPQANVADPSGDEDDPDSSNDGSNGSDSDDTSVGENGSNGSTSSGNGSGAGTGSSTTGGSTLIKGIEETTVKTSSALTSGGKVRLSWTKSAGYKVDYYEVYRSTSKNSGYGTTPIYVTSSGSKLTYTNTAGLKKGKTYYYKVRGVRVINGKKYYTQYSNKVWRTI